MKRYMNLKMHRDRSYTFFWDCLNTHIFYNRPSASPLVTVKYKEQYCINPETGSMALLYLWHLRVHCLMGLLLVFLFVPQVPNKIFPQYHIKPNIKEMNYMHSRRNKKMYIHYIIISGFFRLPCNMHIQSSGSSMPGNAAWNVWNLFHLATIIFHFLPLLCCACGKMSEWELVTQKVGWQDLPNNNCQIK